MDAITISIFENALARLAGKIPFEDDYSQWNSTSSRVVEVPWIASLLATKQPCHIFDIGLSLASLDYLGLLLSYSQAPGISLQAIDIIDPERVQSRYPIEWWEAITRIDVTVGDIRELKTEGSLYDMVTCISVLEHIGFDKPSQGDPHSAFDRAIEPEKVKLSRPPDTDGRVLAVLRSLLKDGGRLAITVPMGQGGPMLLRDSLGYFCAQHVYSPQDWATLIHASGLILEKALFFAIDKRLTWRRVASPEELATLPNAPLSHAPGVGMGLLVKR